MLPDAISTTLFVAGLGWIGYSFRQWDGFPEAADKWIRQHDEARSTRQGELLTTVLAFTLPDLARTYLALTPPEPDPVVNRDGLRRTVVSIDDEPELQDVRIREAIVKPILIDLVTRIVERLPTTVGELVVQPRVLEGVQDLGCYAIDVTTYRRRKNRIAWRYQAQVALLAAWLIGIVVAYLGIAPWWTAEAAVTAGVVPLLHGGELELRRQRFKGDLTGSADA